jgi:hypothetical protein
LLNVKVARLLPAVVLVREQASLGSDLLHDLLHSSLLLLNTSDSLSVRLTSAGPADLGDVLALGSSLGANLGSLLELLGSEVTGLLSGDGLGEVGVDLDSEDIDVVAESSTVLLPGANSLSGSDSNALVAGADELLTDVVDVRTKLVNVAVTVEDTFVSDNDHGDGVLGGVVGDVLELVVGVAGERTPAALATGLKEDTVDDLQSVLLALRNNVLEDTAVSAVGADSGKSELRDLLDVGGDLIGGLAVTRVSVRGVCNGPLVAVGLDVVTLVVAASGLGLLYLLGGARGWLGLLGGRGRCRGSVGRLGSLGNLRNGRLGGFRNRRVSGLRLLGDGRVSRLGLLGNGGVCGLSNLRYGRVSRLGLLRDGRWASGLALLLSAGGGLWDSRLRCLWDLGNGRLGHLGNRGLGCLRSTGRVGWLGSLHGRSLSLLLSAGGGRLWDSGNRWLGGLGHRGVARCRRHWHLGVRGHGGLGHSWVSGLGGLRDRRVGGHGSSRDYGSRAGRLGGLSGRSRDVRSRNDD